LPVAGSAWGIVFVGMGLMYLWIAARKRAGKYHLILDPGARTLTLPEIVLGKAPKVIRFDEISKVDVENVTDDFSKHYALRLHWRNDTGKEHEEYLVDWSDKDAVDAFGEWLRTQIGLTP
jgi:hypothetical protein